MSRYTCFFLVVLVLKIGFEVITLKSCLLRSIIHQQLNVVLMLQKNKKNVFIVQKLAFRMFCLFVCAFVHVDLKNFSTYLNVVLTDVFQQPFCNIQYLFNFNQFTRNKLIQIIRVILKTRFTQFKTFINYIHKFYIDAKKVSIVTDCLNENYTNFELSQLISAKGKFQDSQNLTIYLGYANNPFGPSARVSTVEKT